MTMAIARIGVIGAGQMGNGIAHVSAVAGLDVVMHDIDEACAKRGLGTIDKNLQRGVDKGRLSAGDKQSALGRVRTTTRLDDSLDTLVRMTVLIRPSGCQSCDAPRDKPCRADFPHGEDGAEGW